RFSCIGKGNCVPRTRSRPSRRRRPRRARSLTCLVTGATGYVGGRLVPELLAAGHRVRVMSRSPERLRDHPWSADVEVARADAGDPDAVAAACEGVDVVYYLIHALGTGPSFEETDWRTARVMVDAGRAAGVRRLVYLGGLEPQDEELSPHPRSRAEVAAILLAPGYRPWCCGPPSSSARGRRRSRRCGTSPSGCRSW
ncbi:NAD(P)H-binding protein, partial [Blastococcus atacamensis]|uniref:NAD(P)H-binding protein n=1 Tax=Blastococcus atacamensis TaxID=2070508 RepID=UPI001E395E9A